MLGYQCIQQGLCHATGRRGGADDGAEVADILEERWQEWAHYPVDEIGLRVVFGQVAQVLTGLDQVGDEFLVIVSGISFMSMLSSDLHIR